MKITKIESIHLRLPQVTSACDGTQDTLIVRVHTDEGIVGLGEVDSSPTVIRAVIEAPESHKICTGLAEPLIGQNPLEITRLWEVMYERAHYMGRFGPVIHAMSGIDMALWDILGKVAGLPVYQLLGGACQKKLRAYASVLFGDTPEQTRTLGRSLKEQGFTAVKFGWGPFGPDEGLDRELAAAAREGIGDKADLMIDVGCAWTWKTAMRREEMLRQFRPYWIEEPLSQDDFEGYAKLAAVSPTPIAAGEGESGFPAYRRLIQECGLDFIQPDMGRCGGLTVARRIAELAHSHQRQVANHTFKSHVSLAAAIHFVTAMPNAPVLEYCMAESPLRQDVTIQKFPVVDGYVTPPTAPGLGVDLNEETIKRYRVP